MMRISCSSKCEIDFRLPYLLLLTCYWLCWCRCSAETIDSAAADSAELIGSSVLESRGKLSKLRLLDYDDEKALVGSGKRKRLGRQRLHRTRHSVVDNSK